MKTIDYITVYPGGPLESYASDDDLKTMVHYYDLVRHPHFSPARGMHRGGELNAIVAADQRQNALIGLLRSMHLETHKHVVREKVMDHATVHIETVLATLKSRLTRIAQSMGFQVTDNESIQDLMAMIVGMDDDSFFL